MRKIGRFFIEAYQELRKVIWPSREVVLRHTLIVIISVGITMLILSIIDIGLTKLIELIVTPS